MLNAKLHNARGVHKWIFCLYRLIMCTEKLGAYWNVTLASCPGSGESGCTVCRQQNILLHLDGQNSHTNFNCSVLYYFSFYLSIGTYKYLTCITQFYHVIQSKYQLALMLSKCQNIAGGSLVLHVENFKKTDKKSNFTPHTFQSKVFINDSKIDFNESKLRNVRSAVDKL